ncbi:MAG: hypothetical protein HY000_13070 [Planctomycetes bacterium]|nr:hypothetical protein [Planctomycetota bacterium]
MIPNPTINYTAGSSTATLSFTPVANATGQATITVTLADNGGGTNTLIRIFTVTVTAGNTATLADSQNVAFQEDVPAGIAASDVGQGAELLSSAFSQAYSITLTPGQIFSGADFGNFRVVDAVPGAGNVLTVLEGASRLLPAAVYDPDPNDGAAFSKYEWDFLGNGTFVETASPQASYIYADDGTYVARLRVTYGTLIYEDTVTVHVGQQPLLLTPPSDQSADEGQPSSFNLGTLIAPGSEFRVNTSTENHQRLARVAMDAKGDFVVVWQSYGQDGSAWGIYA